MVSNYPRVPCLILGFTRLNSLRKLIEDLQDQETPRIYISIDGPRNPEDISAQDQIYKMIAEVASRSKSKIYLFKHQKNINLRSAVISGISWFFENEELGVILEDDLIIHPFFQDYFSSCLMNQYVKENFMTISGNQFLGNGDYSYICFPLIWGWATWREEWNQIRKALESPLRQTNWGLRNMSLNGFVAAGLIRVRFGLLQSWAIILLAASLKNSWWHLTPPFSLVVNSGSDKKATHTLSVPAYASVFSELHSALPKLPNSINRNKMLEKFIVRKHYGIRFYNMVSPLKAILEVLFRY